MKPQGRVVDKRGGSGLANQNSIDRQSTERAGGKSDLKTNSHISDFEIMEKIGDGAYSQVYKVKRLEDKIEYAMKKVKLDHLSEKERENAINEVRILASIRHPNVI